jgi:hypothetical protein
VDPNDFYFLFKRHGGRFSSEISGVPWDFWRALTLAGEQIDFGCDFSGSKCIAFRTGYLDYLKNTKTWLCCHNCSANIGYLDFLEEDEDYSRIADLFHPNTGFLGKNGCLLPFEYRSRTCLTHQCLYFCENPGQIPGIVRSYTKYLNNPGELYSLYLRQRLDSSEGGDSGGNYASFILSKLSA